MEIEFQELANNDNLLMQTPEEFKAEEEAKDFDYFKLNLQSIEEVSILDEETQEIEQSFEKNYSNINCWINI